MTSDSSLENVASVAAMPLEYGSETLDPFLPVVRKIGLLLFIAGVLTVASSIFQLGSLGWAIGPNRYYSWMTIIEIVVAAFEVAAGATAMRQATKLNWLWAWVWIDIIGNSMSHLFMVWANVAMNPRQAMFRVLENAIYQLLWMPLGWVLPICVMIVLVYRRRFVGGDAPR